MSITIESLGSKIKEQAGLVNNIEFNNNFNTVNSKINNINIEINDIAQSNQDKIPNYWNSPSSIASITNTVLPGTLILVKGTNTTQKIMFDATDNLHSNVYNTLINQITIKCIDNNTTYTLDETSNNISINSTEKSITFSYTATKKSDHLLTVKLKKPNGSTVLTYTKNISKDKIFEFPTMVQTTKSSPYDQTYISVGETVTLNTLFNEAIDSNLTATVEINDVSSNRSVSSTSSDKTISYNLVINNDNDHTGTINLVLVGSIEESYTWNATNILSAANHIYSYPSITQHVGFDNDYGNFNLKINEPGKIRLTLAGGDGLHSNIFSEQLEFVKYKVGAGGTFINRDHTYVTIDKDNNTIEITDITPTSTDDDIYISVKLISINPLNTKLLADRIVDSSEIRGNNFITTMKVLYVWDNDPDTDGTVNHTEPITWSVNHASNYNLGTLTSWSWGNGVSLENGRGTNGFLYNRQDFEDYEWQNDAQTFEILTHTVPGTGKVYKLNRDPGSGGWKFLKEGALRTNFVRKDYPVDVFTENMSLDPGYWTYTPIVNEDLTVAGMLDWRNVMPVRPVTSVNHLLMFKFNDMNSLSSITAGGWRILDTYLNICISGEQTASAIASFGNDRDGGSSTADWKYNHSQTTDPNKQYAFSVGRPLNPAFGVHFTMGDFPGLAADNLIIVEIRLIGTYTPNPHHISNVYYKLDFTDFEVKVYFWADNTWKSTIKKTRNSPQPTPLMEEVDLEGYFAVGSDRWSTPSIPHTWFATGYSDHNWVNERVDAINFLTERYTNSTLTTQQLVW